MEIIPPRNSTSQPTAPASPAPSPTAAPPPPKRWHLPSLAPFQSALSTLGLLASALAIAVVLNSFVIQSYQVDGQSMQNTLQNNDRLIVDKIPRTLSRITGHQYIPKRGQIIIFNEDGLPGFVGRKQLIKRVIGLPGERVVVSGGHITVYNAAHPDGFNPDLDTGYHIDATNTVGDIDTTLQPDELYVCGDNRGNSEDSRYFGPIKTNQVVAKLVLRILPLNKAKSF